MNSEIAVNVAFGEVGVNLKGFLEKYNFSSINILVDSTTKKLCLPLLDNINKPNIIEIGEGEKFKTLETCQSVWDNLLDKKVDRNALVINLGGGVVTDLGGFVAATYKRGIDFVHIPTTLLSQTDAAIGGKQGVDYGVYKNIIGVFKNPLNVFIDTRFLQTLPKRQLLNGFAEVIKYALIEDLNMWQDLNQINDIQQADWKTLVEHSVSIKKSIVEMDPLEKGKRKILNFGHSIGHALESYSLEHDKDSLLHGEAIAIGMICEAYIATKLAGLNEKDLDSITRYINTFFEKYNIAASSYTHLLHIIKNDKKNNKEQILMSLVSSIGNCKFNIEVSEALIIESLDYYKSN